MIPTVPLNVTSLSINKLFETSRCIGKSNYDYGKKS